MSDFWEICRSAKPPQRLPTSICLRYCPSGFMEAHRDLQRSIMFPWQAMCPLSNPGEDYEGGEFFVQPGKKDVWNVNLKGPLTLPFGRFEILYLDDEIRIIRTGQGWRVESTEERLQATAQRAEAVGLKLRSANCQLEILASRWGGTRLSEAITREERRGLHFALQDFLAEAPVAPVATPLLPESGGTSPHAVQADEETWEEWPEASHSPVPPLQSLEPEPDLASQLNALLKSRGGPVGEACGVRTGGLGPVGKPQPFGQGLEACRLQLGPRSRRLDIEVFQPSSETIWMMRRMAPAEREVAMKNHLPSFKTLCCHWAARNPSMDGERMWSRECF
eukprot:g30310.t1